MTSPKAAPAKIFICYRRGSAGWPASWLADQLTKHFGAESVFQDVESILPGDDFPAEIESAIAACWAFLVVIGKGWLAAEGDSGRRLDDPRDWVRLELEAALARDVRVIPVLLDGAKMPAADDLPLTVQGLSRKHAVALDPVTRDTRSLVSVLEAVRGNPPEPDPRTDETASGDAGSSGQPNTIAGVKLTRRRLIAGVAAIAALAAAGAWLAEELSPSREPLSANPVTFTAMATVADAVFDRTGSYLAWGGDDKTVTLWSPNGSTAPQGLPARHDDSIEDLAFQPDGKVLASCDGSGSIWLWDPARRSPPRRLAPQTSPGTGLWSIAFGHAGRLISGSKDGRVTLWHVSGSTSKPLLNLGVGADVFAVAAAPGAIFAAGSGDIFAGGSANGEIRFWNQDGLPVFPNDLSLGPIRRIAFSPSGLVAVGSDTSSIYLFDPRKPAAVTSYQDHVGGVYALDFDPQDPQRFASGGYDGILRLWSLNSSTPVVRKDGFGAIRGLAFNPQGTLLAAARDDHTVQVWTV
jgi:TIR domain/WD domain, G-beta repeat